MRASKWVISDTHRRKGYGCGVSHRSSGWMISRSRCGCCDAVPATCSPPRHHGAAHDTSSCRSFIWTRKVLRRLASPMRTMTACLHSLLFSLRFSSTIFPRLSGVDSLQRRSLRPLSATIALDLLPVCCDRVVMQKHRRFMADSALACGVLQSHSVVMAGHGLFVVSNPMV